MPKYHIVHLIGPEAKKYVTDIANIRIQVFKEFPYLYAGTLEYEQEYSDYFSKDERAILIAAMQDERIIGFITGMPLSLENPLTKDVAQKLLAKGLTDISHYYYLGEAIVLAEYRKPLLIYNLFKKFKEETKNFTYQKIGILTVIRDKNHPLRPAGYRSIESILKYFKFHPTDIIIDFEWPTFQASGEIENAANPMLFWEHEV